MKISNSILVAAVAIGAGWTLSSMAADSVVNSSSQKVEKVAPAKTEVQKTEKVQKSNKHAKRKTKKENHAG